MRLSNAFRARTVRLACIATLCSVAPCAHATLSDVRINEVMASYNGNSTVQFVELLVADETSKAWGPGTGEATGRAQIEFYNARGERTGRYVFPHDAPAGGRTVLVATGYYAAMKNALPPDFRMPREIMPISGKVCFANNPDSAAAVTARSCVSYGAYTGTPEAEGAPVRTELPTLGASSLKRTSGFDFASSDPGNRAFALGTPTPANTTVGTTTDIINNGRPAGGHRFKAATTVKQGQNLFMNERFEGNGRTCGTCHIPPFFNMTPAHVAAKKPWDPLFLAEKNRGINHVTLTAPSTPSDLRGTITDTKGNTAYVVKGSGDEYLVTNGLRLTGLVMDERGNRAVIDAVDAGDLRGPNPVNGSTNGLEDPTGRRLRASNDTHFPQGRSLVLENIDGFDQLEVFRKSPHLLNLKDTAPYGFSGNFATLSEFTTGAVVQHFPLSLQRREGTDFRLPTAAELEALVKFQESITLRPSGNPRLNPDPAPALYNATTFTQLFGASEFFSLCNGCHSGPLHAHHNGDFSKTLPLATGVANATINNDDALPSEPPTAAAGQSTRAFDTPPLLGIRHTAPYFHDASAATLDDAINFYNSPAFKQAVALLPPSQNGGPLLPDPNFQISEGAKTALISFLRTLTTLPVDFPRGLSFGTATVNSVTTDSVSIVNSGKIPITIKSVRKNAFPRMTAPQGARERFDRRGLPEVTSPTGSGMFAVDADQFVTPGDLVGRVIAPGQSLAIQIRFAPSQATPLGDAFWSAILELDLEDDAGEPWPIGIQLIGKAN